VRLTLDQLIERLDELAEEADRVAEDIRPIELIPGDVWVSANGIADDLARLARDARSDLRAPTAR
jgi:hypothetical protein